MTKQRFPARGPRGEAVIIIRTGGEDDPRQRGALDLAGDAYWLASGERLKPTDDPRVFLDVDGRRFTLA